MGTCLQTETKELQRVATGTTNDEMSQVAVRITSMELYKVYLPFVQVYHVAMGSVEGQSNIICKLNTNVSGLSGFGEANPLYPKFTTESCDSIWKISTNGIFPVIKNKNPLEIDSLCQELDAKVDDSNLIAKGMINMALWDIYGKYHQKPVYQCLCEKYNVDVTKVNREIPLLYPFSDQSVEEDSKMLHQKWQQGYRTFMFKMGGNQDIKYQIQRVRAAQESEFGPIGGEQGFRLICDANQGFDFDQSVEFIKGCKDVNLSMFEQPVDKKNFKGLKQLNDICKQEASFGISLDESVQDAESIEYCLENEIAGAYSLKVSKNGGISKLFEVTRLCKKYGVQVYFNSMLEFGISQASLLAVAAVTDNIMKDIGHCFMSTLRFKDDVTDFPDLITDDKVATLSDKPGLGVNVNQEKLEKYATEKTICKDSVSKL